MIYFIKIILILLLATNSFSQQGWIQQNSEVSSALYSVQFIDSNTGWCAGENGIILKTTNSGENWVQQSTGTPYHLRSIAITSTEIGYAAGDTGTFLKTTNGGGNWFQINLTSNTSFYSISFLNDSIGFAGGFNIDKIDPTYIFQTSNGGITWDSTEVIANYIYQVHFLNPVTGWVIAGSMVIQGEWLSKTTNGGLNWFGQYGQSSWKELNVFFVDSLYGWMSGRSGLFDVIYRTTNGGSDWMPQDFPKITTRANSIYFVNRSNGWVSGASIQATTNGGVSWMDQFFSPPGIEFRSIHFIDSLTGWCVGDSGRILKTTTGGIIVSVDPVANIIPEDYRLFQNYPNPFNPVTIIRYSIQSNPKDETSNVRLTVYDALGREVTVLVNEKKDPGNYSIEFYAGSDMIGGRDLSSGIYFYSLSVNGNLIDAKRMILLQ
jgi:photosystem II stability/assembly factor-like uncharacterized protein